MEVTGDTYILLYTAVHSTGLTPLFLLQNVGTGSGTALVVSTVEREEEAHITAEKHPNYTPTYGIMSSA